MRHHHYALCLLALSSISLLPSVAQASEYGCKVLLCLSNPGGPREFPECHPPIDQLYDDLKHDRPFPTCDEAGNNYAKRIFDPFDPCPEGTQAAAAGTHIAQVQPQPSKAGGSSVWGQLPLPRLQQGSSQVSINGPQGARACVGKLVNAYTVSDCADCQAYKVFVYDKVVWQLPQSPRAIDVFLDGAWSRRIRY